MRIGMTIQFLGAFQGRVAVLGIAAVSRFFWEAFFSQVEEKIESNPEYFGYFGGTIMIDGYLRLVNQCIDCLTESLVFLIKSPMDSTVSFPIVSTCPASRSSSRLVD